MPHWIEVSFTRYNVNKNPPGGVNSHYHDFIFIVKHLKDPPLKDDISEPANTSGSIQGASGNKAGMEIRWTWYREDHYAICIWIY
jgi:hypothetical protein